MSFHFLFFDIFQYIAIVFGITIGYHRVQSNMFCSIVRSSVNYVKDFSSKVFTPTEEKKINKV